jgi:hypothetical protein
MVITSVMPQANAARASAKKARFISVAQAGSYQLGK